MAKTATYSLINSTTLGSTSATVTFSSIPQTFTDLLVVVHTGTTLNAGLQLRLNGDSGTNYSSLVTYATGSSTGSGAYANLDKIYSNIVGSLPTTLIASAIWNIMGYSNSNTFKTVIGRYSDPTTETNASVSMWRNTSAINEVTLRTPTSTYLVGSTFKLYGIEAGNL